MCQMAQGPVDSLYRTWGLCRSVRRPCRASAGDSWTDVHRAPAGRREGSFSWSRKSGQEANATAQGAIKTVVLGWAGWTG